MITISSPPPPKPTLPPLLKIREVTRLLSLSPGSVKALIESGDLYAKPLNPSRRRRKRLHVRITTGSVLDFYQKRFGQPLPTALQTAFAS